jgi:hypothetical protein
MVKVSKNLSAPASAEFLQGEVYIPDWLLSGYRSRHPGTSDVDSLAKHLYNKVMNMLGVENYLQFKEGYKTYFGHNPGSSIAVPVLSNLPPSNTFISVHTGRVTSSGITITDSAVTPLQAKYNKLVAEHESLLKLVKFNAIYHELRRVTAEHNQLKLNHAHFLDSYRLSLIEKGDFKQCLDALSTEHRRLRRRHKNLSGRHKFVTHRHDVLTAQYDTLSIDQDNLLERYDLACASHDVFRECAHKQLRLCYDNGMEAQRNLIIMVKETRNTLQALSNQLTSAYRKYPKICPQGYTAWQHPPLPTIVPPIIRLSNAGHLMYHARETRHIQKLVERRCKSRN